jgi:hypothetical protein
MVKNVKYPHVSGGRSYLIEGAKDSAKKILKLNNSWSIRSAVDIAENSSMRDYPEIRAKLRQMLSIAYEVDKLLENIQSQPEDIEAMRQKYGPNYGR